MVWAKNVWDRYLILVDLQVRVRVTDGVLSDIVTISVLILNNTYDKADPPTSKAGSTGPKVQPRRRTKPISQLLKSLCQAYNLLAERPMDSYTLQQVRRVRPVP